MKLSLQIYNQLKLAQPSRYLFSQAEFSSNKKKYIVRFLPDLQEGGKIVIPVSLGRYNGAEKRRKEYDDILKTLFRHTASLLQLGILSRVDVISTADLQRINWNDQLTDEIENHFFNTHNDLLRKQTKHYKWKDWIQEQGITDFEKNYKLIKDKSTEGTEWHDLMVKTHHSVNMSSNLEKSIEYQTREYAAVMLMKSYDNLVYTGPISLAWAYMYHIFPQMPLPTFTRACFDNHQSMVSMADANHTIKILLANLEQTLTSPNFPKTEKEKLISSGLSLFYAYEPKKSKKKDEEKLNRNDKIEIGYNV